MKKLAHLMFQSALIGIVFTVPPFLVRSIILAILAIGITITATDVKNPYVITIQVAFELILSFFMLSLLINPPGVRISRYSLERRCYSNIRVLSSAVEMYNMDNYPLMDTLDVDKLIKLGYLKADKNKAYLTCPEIKEPIYKGFELSKHGYVYCLKHGALDPPTYTTKLNQMVIEDMKSFNKVLKQEKRNAENLEIQARQITKNSQKWRTAVIAIIFILGIIFLVYIKII